VPLSVLGFSDLEATVYRALLADPGADLRSLAERTGTDDEALRTVLDTLSDRGIITIDAGGLHVPDPEIALGALIERLEDRLMEQYRRVSAARSKVAGLRLEVASRAPAGDVEVERLEGLDAVRNRIAELSFFARTSVKAIHPGGPQSAASIEASRPLDRRAARRGMSIQVVHERSVLSDELNCTYLHELVLLGVRVKITDRLPQRLIILDDQVAVVPIDPADSRRGALVVRQPALVAGLMDLFEHAWTAANDPPWAAPEHGDGLEEVTETDRRILALLAEGSTDEVAAREFGISVRHLRRSIARLMAELGARSRFEAGVEAARRGWI